MLDGMCHAPDGVVVHDNLLFDAASSSVEESKGKPVTALEAAAVEANRAVAADSSITMLCEEVSRLFTQYNAAFKCGDDAHLSKHKQPLRPGLYNMLRCVDSTSGTKVLPALG